MRLFFSKAESFSVFVLPDHDEEPRVEADSPRVVEAGNDSPPVEPESSPANGPQILRKTPKTNVIKNARMHNLCDQIQYLRAYFLLLEVLARSWRLEFYSNIANYPFLSGWPTGIGASGPRLRGTSPLAHTYSRLES